MADSDNSTTLPSVTRRRLMAGMAAVAASRPLGVSAHESAAGLQGHGDPVLVLFQTWQKSHDKTLALCRKQQRLETYLARTIGFPCAQVRLGDGRDVTIHSIENLVDIVSPEEEAIWSRAVGDLASHQARWDAADIEIGYSRTRELERQSEKAKQALLDALPSTPASSVVGALAKLTVILGEGEHWENPADFPWPHIRSVLDDLARLHHLDPTAISRDGKAGEPAPDQCIPGPDDCSTG